MGVGQSNGDEGRRSHLGSHEDFLELCAISTTGELSEAERKTLSDHLSDCEACQSALKEFQTVSEIAAPLAASEIASHHLNSDESCSSTDTVPVGAAAPRDAGNHAAHPSDKQRDLSSGTINGLYRARLDWNLAWVSLAAGIVLMIALGIYSFETGKRRASEMVRIPSGPTVSDEKIKALERQISDAGHESELLKAQLAERERTIAGLKQQAEQQAATLSELKLAQLNLSRDAATAETDKRQATQDRVDVNRRLADTEAALQKTQEDLESARQQRSIDGQQRASLETQLHELSAELREREQTIGWKDELLAHDRDIRDLMGARDLYIAEVYDVARDGATQKPYGRVFYTKGKSLVFYAYDLDQQSGIRNASTFQAWGRRGPDKEQALNLGIFYEDTTAKKRWVLKSDNTEMLSQIDAVFVTVEPNGGSHKPSGKALLFAYLKIDPNHP